MCVGACGSVLQPLISAFCCSCSACCWCLQLRTLLLCVCGSLLCIFSHDVCVYAFVCVLRVGTATVQQQSHSKFVWTTSPGVLTLHIICYAYVCVVCSMIRKHAAWATTCCCTSIIMFELNNSTEQDRSSCWPLIPGTMNSLFDQYSSPCSTFLPTQAVATVLPACPYFSTCVTPGISRPTHPEGAPCTWYVYMIHIRGEPPAYILHQVMYNPKYARSKYDTQLANMSFDDLTAAEASFFFFNAHQVQQY